MLHQIETERRVALAHWQARLSSIADGRARLVSDWLRARSADAEVLAAIPSLRAALSGQVGSRVLGGSRSDVLRRLLADLDRAAVAHGYASIAVLDLNGRLVAQYGGSQGLGPIGTGTALDVARSGRVRFDLLKEGAAYKFLSITLPVRATGKSESSGPTLRPVLGVVAVRMDPARGLFPLLVDETAPTRTGETVLFTAPAGVQEHTIRPRDVLQITVMGHADLSKPYPVDADGSLAFPLVGRVRASGLTTTVFANQLRNALEKDYLVSPQVVVAAKDSKEETRPERSEGAYLSPMRHAPAGWAAVRRSLDSLTAAARAAAEGRESLTETTDYREVPVFAAVRWIVPTGWGLALKIDRDEALAEFYHSGRLAGLAAAVLTLALGGLLVSLWRQHQRLRQLQG